MEQEVGNSNIIANDFDQFCGFIVGEGHYAVSVLDVQEIIKPQLVTPIPLAENYIRGLINLRGQIVTAIDLRKLFGLEADLTADHMNVIVRSKDSLYSLVVDEICDVIDVDDSTYESVPETLDPKIRLFIKGVYKLSDNLLILLDLKKIFNTIGNCDH